MSTVSTAQQQERAARVKSLLARKLKPNGEGGFSSQGYLSAIGLIGEVVNLLKADISASLRIPTRVNEILAERGQVALRAEQIDVMLDLTSEQVEALELAIVESGQPLQ